MKVKIVIEYDPEDENCDIFCNEHFTDDQLSALLHLFAETVEEGSQRAVH